jgi:hypothetical protein
VLRAGDALRLAVDPHLDEHHFPVALVAALAENFFGLSQYQSQYSSQRSAPAGDTPVGAVREPRVRWYLNGILQRVGGAAQVIAIGEFVRMGCPVSTSSFELGERSFTRRWACRSVARQLQGGSVIVAADTAR